MYLWPVHVDVWQKARRYCNYPPIKDKIKNPKHNIVNQLDSNKHFIKKIPTRNEFRRDYPDQFPVSS